MLVGFIYIRHNNNCQQFEVQFLTLPMQFLGQASDSIPSEHSWALEEIQKNPKNEFAVWDYVAHLQGFRSWNEAKSAGVYVICLRTKQCPPFFLFLNTSRMHCVPQNLSVFCIDPSYYKKSAQGSMTQTNHAASQIIWGSIIATSELLCKMHTSSRSLLMRWTSWNQQPKPWTHRHGTAGGSLRTASTHGSWWPLFATKAGTGPFQPAKCCCVFLGMISTSKWPPCALPANSFNDQ